MGACLNDMDLKDVRLSENAMDQLEALLDHERTNYRARVLDEKGELLYGEPSADGLLPVAKNTYQIIADGSERFFTSYYYASYDVSQVETTKITIESYLDPSLSANDEFAVWGPLYTAVLSWRYAFPVLCVVLLIACALLYVFLMCAAGHRPSEEGVSRRWIDRIPTDVFYVLVALCGAGLVGTLYVLLFEQGYPANISTIVPLVLIGTLLSMLALLVFLLLSMSTAVRLKTHTFLSTMLLWQLLCWIWRGVRAVCRGIRNVALNLPALWKLLLISAAYGVLTLIMVAARDGLAVFVWLVASIALILLLCHAALGFSRLCKGASALSSGDLAHQIALKGLTHGEKRMATDLSRIGEGMSRAVEARMKSERMKTDLITNVSHDLKTPLTSIVNYVDLLKKEELHNETADEYVAVLDRQAQKLKKLTEDIVEASKASSGAIKVNLAPVDAGELLRQCAAEYAERFAAAQITAVLRTPENPLLVLADGRLLWRVYDNLLGNVVKYAMPGTRVYLDAAAGEKSAALTIRNISREPLEVSGSELTERFVRGDSSRHAEGSGLGLSIASSLMALQNGTLTILPDGDLFRAEIHLPLGNSTPTEADATATDRATDGRPDGANTAQ